MPCPIPSRLFYVVDSRNNLRFLVDTGAAISVLPLEKNSTLKPCQLRLQAANGTSINTFGTRSITLNIGMRRDFTWEFTVADVKMPILGADFLAYYDLAVRMNTHSLTDNLTRLSVIGSCSKHTTTGISMATCHSKDYMDILNQYQDLLRPTGTLDPTKHQTEHHIKTTGQPAFSRPRRLAPDRLKFAKKAFDDMLRDGVIRPSDSPYSSPLHLVAKPGKGDFRVCVDYRKLNTTTVRDRYPIPHLHDFASGLQGAKVFSKIDLTKAYYQVPVAPDDIQKTAVTTPFGLFEFLKMPFGLCNAAQTFQRLMDEVLRGFPFVFAYIDDILIASEDTATHKRHLNEVFQRLSHFGFCINLDKCVFGSDHIDFLGHYTDANGITPVADKVKTIADFPVPASVKQLRRFIGMINFYRRFIPSCSRILTPLTNLIQRKNIAITLENEAMEAFKAAKTALGNFSKLAFIEDNPKADIYLTTDASESAVGAVIEQVCSSKRRPIAFFSSKLSKAQSRYSTFSRELLAIFRAVKHFRHLLEGRSFAIFTDHKPLTTVMNTNSDKYTSREIRYLDYISQFTTDIRYIKGTDNTVADALSRTEIFHLTETQSLSQDLIADAQETDITLKQVLSDTSLDLQKCPAPFSNKALYCDIKSNVPRPYIPPSLRRQVFDHLHGLSHPSKRATLKLISDRFVWPNMNAEIREWVTTCLQCQSCKVHRHTKSPMGTFSEPDSRFSHIHLDLVGPLPTSQGYQYLLTIVDRFSRWPTAIPIRDISAVTMAKTILREWIAVFGTPKVVTTDRGPQFQSCLFREFTELLGAKHIRTTAYHPCANGLVERFHRTLKTSLSTKSNNGNWVDELPLVLLSLRNTLKEDLKCSAAELVFGTSLSLPGQYFTPVTNSTPACSFIQELRLKMANLSYTPPRHRPVDVHLPSKLQEAEFVFLRTDQVKRPITPAYTGPFRVLKRAEKYFEIQKGIHTDTVSIDRLKPAFLEKRTPPPTTSPQDDEIYEPSDSDTPPTSEPKLTRSGRRVTFPRKFESFRYF